MLKGLLGVMIDTLVNSMTPAIRSALEDMIKSWAKEAYKTPNKADDLAVLAVCTVLGVDIPPKEE